MMERSREFKRAMDNSVYHKGYPFNYRERRGTPSIQVSVALDGRQADVDVDYRSSMFPVMLFNGHLSSSNSDVRAGNNVDRHDGQWSGLQDWWRSFFGVDLTSAPDGVGRDRLAGAAESSARGEEEFSGDGARLPAGVAGRRQRRGGHGLRVRTRLRVSGGGHARSVCLRPRPGAVSDHGQSESGVRRPRSARLARRLDDGNAVDDSWTQGGASRRSGAVCDLRSARRRRGQVRLREPDDTGLGGDPAGRRRRTFRHRLPHRRVEEGRLDRVAVGEGGRVLEDRVVAGGAGRRSNAAAAGAAAATGRARQAGSHARARGQGLRGRLDYPQGLRRRVWIPVQPMLRVLRRDARTRRPAVHIVR